MWPFKKSKTKLNSKIELALSIGHLDKARQYYILASLESMLPDKDDPQKISIAFNSLFGRRNPFMQSGRSSACLGAMMSDDFSHRTYTTALQSVFTGIGNGLFSLTDLLDVLKQKLDLLENEAQHLPGVAPSDLNPPWDDSI